MTHMEDYQKTAISEANIEKMYENATIVCLSEGRVRYILPEELSMGIFKQSKFRKRKYEFLSNI